MFRVKKLVFSRLSTRELNETATSSAKKPHEEKRVSSSFSLSLHFMGTSTLDDDVETLRSV